MDFAHVSSTSATREYVSVTENIAEDNEESETKYF